MFRKELIIVVIRWMGAFRKGGSTLHQSLSYELGDPCREVAGEHILDDSKIAHVKVGLLVHPSAVIRTFTGDCWSEPEDGILVKGRNPRTARWSHHREAFCLAKYTAIVIKVPLAELTKEVRGAILFHARKSKLPVLHLKGTTLKHVDY
jgi:hypothetical protein